MNYYQLTTGIEEDDSDEETDNPWLSSARQDELPSAVSSCLSQATVEDLMKELSRNSSLEDNNNAVQNIKTPLPPVSPVSSVSGESSGGVLMRRKSSGRSYGHRASQRFSRLLEGVTSLVSMSTMTATRTEEPHQEEEETDGPASLPYWVEASQNIYKVSRQEFLEGKVSPVIIKVAQATL